MGRGGFPADTRRAPARGGVTGGCFRVQLQLWRGNAQAQRLRCDFQPRVDAADVVIVEEKFVECDGSFSAIDWLGDACGYALSSASLSSCPPPGTPTSCPPSSTGRCCSGSAPGVLTCEREHKDLEGERFFAEGTGELSLLARTEIHAERQPYFSLSRHRPSGDGDCI